MTPIYFATNRARDPQAEGGYGAGSIANPAQHDHGVITVSATNLKDAASGTLAPATALNPGGFDAVTRAAILAAEKNLLVFVHGFANSFADAIKRAAFNQAWFAASRQPAADCTVLAFTWPSPGHVVDLEDKSIDPTAQYREERKIAAAAGPALAAFLRQALGLAAQMKQANPARRAFLLAHSMGNHVLNAAVPAFFASPAAFTPFDEAILAAADEHRHALERPDRSEMFRLRDLAQRHSIYFSTRDATLDLLSRPINNFIPLGLRGPASATNTTLYPPPTSRQVNCTDAWDLLDVDQSIKFDASHQYYRRSPTVRDDIARLMSAGAVQPGQSRLRASFWRWW